MEVTDSPTIAPIALGQLLLSKIDAQSAAAIEAAIDAKIRPAIRAECLAEAREGLKPELAQYKAKIDDEGARYKKTVERNATIWVESEVARETSEMRTDLEDTITGLKEKLRSTRQERDDVTELLIHLVRQVFGPAPKRIFPGSRHVTEVDVFRLNSILTNHGLRLHTVRSSHVEDLVKTRLDQSRWEGRAVFYLEDGARGVLEPDENEDVGTIAEASQDGATIN